MPKAKGYWKYICDRCNKFIEVPEGVAPLMYLEELNNKELFFVRRSLAGKVLYYCSKDCVDKHFSVGKKNTFNFNIKFLRGLL